MPIDLTDELKEVMAGIKIITEQMRLALATIQSAADAVHQQVNHVGTLVDKVNDAATAAKVTLANADALIAKIDPKWPLK